MNKFLYLLFPFIGGIFILSSCNQNEGLGGSSSIEGYVYNIVHQSGDFSFTPDTVPAAGERIYIIYGDNEDGPVANKDVRTNLKGMYRFEYLRKGNYIVYAFSEYPEQLNKQKEAVLQSVKVGSGTAYAGSIYIHSGKGYGLSMIKGRAMIQYYDRGALPNLLSPYRNPLPATGERVFLKRAGEEHFIDDVRVSNRGVFIFDRVPPGKYEVYANQEVIDERRVTIPTDSKFIEIEADAPPKVYEIEEDIIINLNL